MNSKILIVFIVFYSVLGAQTSEELKKFMETYNKIKVDQEANEVVKKGIESEKDVEERPVRLLVSPGDITKYYKEKMNVIQNEISDLNDLINISDSIPPLSDFGYDFFQKRDSIEYIDNLKLTDDYVLGYGDEVIITVWGQVEHNDKLLIQRDGTIFVKNVGLLYLGGKSISDAKQYIYDRFSSVYATLQSTSPKSFLSLSISKVKNINVVVSGHVNFPGNYVVSPTISLTNLLINAGGIKESGTLRNIMLSRNGVVIDSIDLYPLLTGSNFNHASKFSDNDIIIIPSRGSTVALTGSIRIPGYFEIKYDSIKSLISYGGGKKSDAKSVLFLFRKNGSNLLIDENDLNQKLSVADSIHVPASYSISNYISISVDGRKTTNIPWIKDISYEKIFSLIDLDVEDIKSIELVRKVNKVRNESYLLQNYDGGSFEFLPFDFLTINQKKINKKLNTVYIKGMVDSPGLYPIVSENETLNSIIKRSGGLLPTAELANVIVIRDTTKIGSFDGELVIVNGDTVVANSFNGTITIEGEVHNPGKIEWKNYRTIKDYIDLAGGLTAYSDKKHIVLIAPYGEASKVKRNSRLALLPSSKIIINQKSANEISNKPDRFQQISSLVTSLVTIAILANSTSQNN